MPASPMILLLLAAAFVASALAALSGFGVSVVMMPVLVFALGERDAVPALTIATLLGNLSRAALNRDSLRWSAAGWYLAGAAPAAALGGFLFASAPERTLAALMAAFLLGAVTFRHLRRRAPGTPAAAMPEKRLAAVGLVTGLVSALVGGAGPLVVPFFLAAGLTKAAFIGTEALAAAGVHIVKLFAYGGTRAMSLGAIWAGVVTAPAIIVGTLAGKQITNRVSASTFIVVVEATMIVAALLLLARAGGWLH